MHLQSILCVCTGNICRSPLAEAYLRAAFHERTIGSAGIGAMVGHRIEEQAARIADREGLDVVAHRARQIDAALVTQYDLILVMEQGQLEWIRSRYPEAQGRIFLASHWTDRREISDPFRQSGDYFDQIYAQLRTALDAWVAKLKPVNQARP